MILKETLVQCAQALFPTRVYPVAVVCSFCLYFQFVMTLKWYYGAFAVCLAFIRCLLEEAVTAWKPVCV